MDGSNNILQISNMNLKLNSILKDLFKNLYTLAQFLYLKDLVTGAMKVGMEDKESSDKKRKKIEEKIDALDAEIKEQMFGKRQSSGPGLDLKVFMENLKEQWAKEKASSGVDSEEELKFQIFDQFKLYRAIDYVLLAKSMTIDKINELIALLQSDQEIT